MMAMMTMMTVMTCVMMMAMMMTMMTMCTKSISSVRPKDPDSHGETSPPNNHLRTICISHLHPPTPIPIQQILYPTPIRISLPTPLNKKSLLQIRVLLVKKS